MVKHIMVKSIEVAKELKKRVLEIQEVENVFIIPQDSEETLVGIMHSFEEDKIIEDLVTPLLLEIQGEDTNDSPEKIRGERILKILKTRLKMLEANRQIYEEQAIALAKENGDFTQLNRDIDICDGRLQELHYTIEILGRN